MVRTRRMTGLIGTLGLVAVAGIAPASAQPARQGGPAIQTIEADPIRCWWRTSASAVRVGESFSLVLTCAVIENDEITVVPDQSRLDPAVMQFPPFEVIGGMRGEDLHSNQRRFFQYQYTLRLINEDLFGKDAKLPGIQIAYQVQSRGEQGAALRGRDRTYTLPSESIRVLSLVPNDATEIRDVPSWTFGDIDAQRFRARVFLIVAGVLFTSAALVVILAFIRLTRRYREQTPIGQRVLSDHAILGGVGRELSFVQRRSHDGWTHELAGRALAVFRIAGTVALRRRVSQTVAGARTNAHEGQLLMRGGLLRGKKVLLSGSVTSDVLAQELAQSSATEPASSGRQQCLEDLGTALSRLTVARFGRDDTFDGTALDESLASGFSILRRLKFESLWPVKKFKELTEFAGELGSRVWSR